MAMSIGAEGIARALGSASRSTSGAWKARCPCHEDAKASLTVGDKPEGGVWVKCHAGCHSSAVQAALVGRNLWPRSSHPPASNKKDAAKDRKRLNEVVEVFAVVPNGAPNLDWRKLGGRAPTHLYEYRTVDGVLTGYVARWDELTEKRIFPVSLVRRRDGTVEWALKAPPPPWGLFGAEALVARPYAPVLLVEGEKSAQRGAQLFPTYTVLSWRSGAANVENADFSPLAGRSVTLWPDADEPGLRAMKQATMALIRAGCASVVQVPVGADLPKGWDIADSPPDGFDIHAALASAEAVTADEGVEQDSQPTYLSEPANPALRPFVLTAAEFMGLDLPAQEELVVPFLTSSSLTMVYAMRGLGKTWLVLTLAINLARGQNFLAYEVPKQRNVLLVDGEMSLFQLQSRIRALSPEPPANFMVLASESLHRAGRPINLHNPDDQRAIEELIEELQREGRRPDVIILDNLSSLSGGKDENDNSALDGLLQWLVRLRHTGLAVVMVHHAGKNGEQRGASRREDLLETSIALKPPPEDATPHQGAHLIMSFPKTRGIRPSPDELELRLISNLDRIEWAYQVPVATDRATEILRLIYEKKPKTQAELAGYAAVKEAAISHQMKKLRTRGHVDTEPLRVLPEGLMRLIEVWPELEFSMLEQGLLPLRDDGIL